MCCVPTFPDDAQRFYVSLAVCASRLNGGRKILPPTEPDRPSLYGWISRPDPIRSFFPHVMDSGITFPIGTAPLDFCTPWPNGFRIQLVPLKLDTTPPGCFQPSPHLSPLPPPPPRHGFLRPVNSWRSRNHLRGCAPPPVHTNAPHTAVSWHQVCFHPRPLPPVEAVYFLFCPHHRDNSWVSADPYLVRPPPS